MGKVPAAVAEAKRSRNDSSTCGGGAPTACLDSTTRWRQCNHQIPFLQQCHKPIHARRRLVFSERRPNHTTLELRRKPQPLLRHNTISVPATFGVVEKYFHHPKQESDFLITSLDRNTTVKISECCGPGWSAPFALSASLTLRIHATKPPTIPLRPIYPWRFSSITHLIWTVTIAHHVRRREARYGILGALLVILGADNTARLLPVIVVSIVRRVTIFTKCTLIIKIVSALIVVFAAGELMAGITRRSCNVRHLTSGEHGRVVGAGRHGSYNRTGQQCQTDSATHCSWETFPKHCLSFPEQGFECSLSSAFL